MQTAARERSQVKPSQALSPSTGELTESRWLPAHKRHRKDISCTHQHPGTAKPTKPSRVAQGDPASSCTAACLGFFPSLFSSAFPRQAASHPEPKAQQELSQQPARDDDIPTAFPGKHFMGWNENNSKGHQSQACSTYRGFSKMCQFI